MQQKGSWDVSVTAVASADIQITTTDCRGCGAQVSGLNNRYACSHCGWVNHWSEGSNTLPSAEDDVDYPGVTSDR